MKLANLPRPAGDNRDFPAEEMSHSPAAPVGLAKATTLIPHHRERQIMQQLRGRGWVKGFYMPSAPKTLSGLVEKRWVETLGSGTDLFFRITEAGMAAMKGPVRISK